MNIGIAKKTCKYNKSSGSLAINGAAINVIIVPKGAAVHARELAISYSVGLNHCAANLLGSPPIIDVPTDVMMLPNNAIG